MSDKKFNVLFLCTGNSARSIIAECLINRWGNGKFVGYSAGSHPRSQINPFTKRILEKNNFPTDELRSKDWSEFATPDSPEMDFVFTLCDKAAAEVCPVWPGQPMTAHWGTEDPAAVEGLDIEKKTAFQMTFSELEHRISVFVNLPFESLDKLKLQNRLDQIGGNKNQPASRSADEAPKIQSNARALVGYSFLVVFGNDDSIDAAELAMLKKLALEDGYIDDEEKKVLKNIFSRVDKDRLTDTVWQEIQRFREENNF
jgi:arsenate reductase